MKINSLLQNVRRVYSDKKNTLITNKMFKRDSKRYLRYSATINKMNSKQVKAKLIFHTHALEKGLSHPNFRPGFGISALEQLFSLLSYCQKGDFDKTCMEYQNALSVLNAYDKRHRELNYRIPEFHNLFDRFNYNVAKNIAGSNTKQRMGNLTHETFTKVVESRKSVREFSSEKVDLNKIRKAAELAILTPSACNRQPWRLYVTDNKRKVQRLLELQGGFKGYEVPPVLGLVTVDLSDFFWVNERNESYIDGGMYAMSLLYALTEQGLATCTLNTMLTNEKVEVIHEILNIPESENLIVFIGIGNYSDTYAIAKSYRRQLSDVINIEG